VTVPGDRGTRPGLQIVTTILRRLHRKGLVAVLACFLPGLAR
jgi:hypothetical protein